MSMFNRSQKGFVRPAIAVSTAVFLMLTFWMAVSASTPLGSAGYLDFSYLGFNGTTSPTGEKPESKLWWNDGFWWGSMFNNTTARYEIYRLNWGSQSWETTGVAIDTRTNSKADTLFVEDPVNPKLFVASHVFAQTGNYITGSSTNRARLYRYSYDRTTQSYTLDAGFPVNIADDRMEALTLGRDPASGRLWITYISQEHVTTPTKHQLFVNASTDSTGLTWGTSTVPSLPFDQSAADTVKAGDMASLVMANGRVAVVWNNSASSATQKTLYVAYRAAGLSPASAKSGWSLAEIPVPEGTDDHINLKSLQATSSGQIFAAVKTSASQQISATVNHVNMVGIDLSAAPVYSRTFPYSDNHAKDSRPIIVLDEADPANATDGNVYLFVTSSDSSGFICYGSLPLKPTIAAMSNFPKGINCGTPFIQDAPSRYGSINNATSMKRSTDSTTGIVVLASDDKPYTTTSPVRVYVHNVMGNPPPVLTARGPFNLVGTVFNAGNISPTATITGTFSKLMNPNTINTTNFTVKDSSSTVDGAISYDGNSRTATFTPKTLLKANAVYTAEMSSAIVDNTNLPLGGAFRNPGPPERWRFTTGPATINFTQANYSEFEKVNPDSAVISVTLDTTSTLPVTVHFTTSDGTATSGDYTFAGGILTFAPGQRVVTFTVPILDDLTTEGNELVNLTLSAPSAQGRLGTQSTAQLIIVDNESTSLQFVPTSLSTAESAGQAVLNVALSTDSAAPIAVDYQVVGGTATNGTDYTLAAGTLNFAPHITSQPITVTILNDTLHELNETIVLQLSNPVSATLGNPGYTATLTINDDDLQPGVKFEQADYTIGEEDGFVTLKVGLTSASALPVTVNFATSNISATAPSDYTANNGTLTFAPGETSKSINVQIIDDNLSENNLDFNVALSDPTEAPLAVPFNAHVTIVDNDPLPSVGFATTLVNSGEAAGSAVIEVDLDAPSGRAVTVDYATSDGAANADVDYTPVQGTLTFAPGEISQFFEIPVLDDGLGEGSETVNLLLNNPSGATADPNKSNGTLTIIDDDAAPVVGFEQTSYTVNENGTSVIVTVLLNSTSGSDVTVDYATSDGTATAGSDYTAASGTITIPAGQFSATFAVPITNDTQSETAETINLTLSNANGAALGTAAATLTITDDDPAAVVFSSANYVVNENGVSAVVTVTLTAPAAGSVTVNYATSDGTATAGSDYTAQTGTLTFDVGQTSKTISIPVADDTTVEGAETVNLALSNPTGATLGAQATATLTINDNDTVIPKQLLFLPVVLRQ